MINFSVCEPQFKFSPVSSVRAIDTQFVGISVQTVERHSIAGNYL